MQIVRNISQIQPYKNVITQQYLASYRKNLETNINLVASGVETVHSSSLQVDDLEKPFLEDPSSHAQTTVSLKQRHTNNIQLPDQLSKSKNPNTFINTIKTNITS